MCDHNHSAMTIRTADRNWYEVVTCRVLTSNSGCTPRLQQLHPPPASQPASCSRTSHQSSSVSLEPPAPGVSCSRSSDVDLMFTVPCVKINDFTESANTVTVRLRTGVHLKTYRKILENQIQPFPQLCSRTCKIGTESSENECK